MTTSTRRPPKPAAPAARTGPTPEQKISAFLKASSAPADTGDWRDDAECRAHDPELWFPVGHSVGWIAQIREAKTICGRCPVQRECLEWALDSGQLNGIWGGLTEGERQELLRDRADFRARSYERCIDAQEYIERRVAERATHRMIASELGVGRSAVSKAWRFFQSEKAAVEAAETVGEVAAA